MNLIQEYEKQINQLNHSKAKKDLLHNKVINLKFKIHWSAKTSTYNVSELIKSKWNLNKE